MQLLTSVTVSIKETVHIPAKHEVQVLGMAHGELQKGIWILEGASNHIKKPIHVANALVKPEKGVVPVQVLNPGTETITIYAGDIVANMEHMNTSQTLMVGSLKVAEDEQEPQIDELQVSRKKQQTLWELVEKLTPDVTREQKRQMYALFIKHAYVLNKDIGKTTLLQHRINTASATPVHQRARRILYSEGECQKLVQEMLDRGVIGFQWSSHCDAAFKILQSKLTSAPILGYPDFTKPFILDTDASDLSLGAVLSQVEDGKERVLCYDRRLLTKEECHYCVTRTCSSHLCE